MARASFEKLKVIELFSCYLKSLLIIFLLSIADFCLMAQTSDCAFYVESNHTRKKIRHSIYPLNFKINENISVSLKMNDKGSSNTIELVLDFEDKSGLPTELGSTLSINFADGTTHSVIARTKKINTSVVYFTLNNTDSNDRFLDKLSKVDIVTLVIRADYEQREISIPETKASIVKKTIQCLLNINKE